jgi:hypothetical protein
MARKRTKSSGTQSCTCDRCGITDPSTVQGTKHRRCGGQQDAPVKAKHSPNGGIRGTWR